MMSKYARLFAFAAVSTLSIIGSAQGATAIAVSESTGAYGISTNIATPEISARWALTKCRRQRAAGDCRIVGQSAEPGFGALIMGPAPRYFFSLAERSAEDARRKAMEACGKAGNAACRETVQWQENEPSVDVTPKAVPTEAQRNLRKVHQLQKQLEFEAAFRLLVDQAAKGSAEAQFETGLAYAEGQGVQKNPARALLWLTRAADRGHAGAGHALNALLEDADATALTEPGRKPPTTVQAAPSRSALSDEQVDALIRAMPDMPTYKDVGVWIAAQGLTEAQKARAVFVWMAENIRYDTDAYFNNAHTFYDAANVFRTRQSVCEGYANLLVAISSAAGVKAVKVVGYSKGYGYKPGEPLSEDDGHAWNAMWFDNAWHLVDSTWGAGSVNDKGLFEKEWKPFWFNADPRIFVYSHWPEKAQWQLLPAAVSRSKYQEMPYVDTYFTANAITMGFPADAVLAAMQSGNLVSVYNIAGLEAKIIQAPVAGTLRTGTDYQVKMLMRQSKAGAIIIDDDFVQESEAGTSHEFLVRPAAGRKMKVSFKGNDGSYWTVLEYNLD